MKSNVQLPFLSLIVASLTPLTMIGCSDPSDKDQHSQDRLLEVPLSAELTQGKSIVDRNCIVCHAQAINGAPILGNKKMWGKRIDQGLEVLINHATEGFAGMMPPKGGKPDLTNEEVALAVKYMVSLVE